MPRVVGIDPGTVTVDVCGIDDGRPFFTATMPTAMALRAPSLVLQLLGAASPLDLVAGPSGYGLPLTHARDLTDDDLRLACLSAEGEPGGIGGLRTFMRQLAQSAAPVVLTPGVVHLPSVPEHRKVNRVDMGTADKLCAAALAVYEQSRRRRCRARDVSLILLELGGAFTAAVAVAEGAVVDGIGGSAGALGVRASGALDGEVAFLAGRFAKDRLFRGGVADIAGTPDASAVALMHPRTVRGRVAREAYVESAAKAVAALAIAIPGVLEVALSGRLAADEPTRDAIARRLKPLLGDVAVRTVHGFAACSHAAQGAALIADGLAGGACAELVETLGIRGASGTVLDHLYVVSPAEARARIGLS